MSGVNISDWMEKHSRDIGNLSDDEKMGLADACDVASHQADFEEWVDGNKDRRRKEWEETYGEMDKDSDEYEPFDQWLGEQSDDLRAEFDESRTADDYYPIWNTIWQFPSSMTAEMLNMERVSALIFFDWEGVTWVGLTGCGMDLSPALYYAYLRYSDLNCNKDAILDGVLRSGVDYYMHVLGRTHFFGLVRLVGKKLMKRYGTESKRRYEEFDESLRILNKMEKEGKVDRMEKKVLGLMVFFRSRRPMPKG